MKSQGTRRMALLPGAVKAVTPSISAALPSALANFDSLPDAANVRLPVVAALFACSTVTVWRRVKKGTLPAGRKLSEGVTAWNVGQLRKALNGEAWQ